MNPIIQITKTGTLFRGQEEDLKQMHAEFDKNHYLRLRDILDPDTLQFIKPYIDKTEFDETVNPQGLGLESCIKPNPSSHLLHFLTNDKKLFQLIEKITGCKRIGCFNGRVYHVTSNHKNYDRWHDDYGSTRMIAMSLNLSSKVYSGGHLQIRDANSKQILHKITNTGFGDAIIFRIALHLDHIVTDVESEASKIAFAGWFQEEPDDQANVKKRFSQLKNKSQEEIQTKSTILTSSIVVAQKNYFSHEVDENTVIFNPCKTSYYSLNKIGAHIWDLIQEPLTISEIKNIVLNEYDIEQEQIEQDLVNLIHTLHSNGLILVKEGIVSKVSI